MNEIREIDDDVFDDEPEDLEHRVFSFLLSEEAVGGPDTVKAVIEYRKQRDKDIESLLDDGWNLFHSVSAGNHAMLFFSRPKEGDEESE
jgi:hypothetical protein